MDATAVESVTAPVRGMHCAACTGKVERALRGVDGVAEASVCIVGRSRGEAIFRERAFRQTAPLSRLCS